MSEKAPRSEKQPKSKEEIAEQYTRIMGKLKERAEKLRYEDKIENTVVTGNEVTVNNSNLLSHTTTLDDGSNVYRGASGGEDSMKLQKIHRGGENGSKILDVQINNGTVERAAFSSQATGSIELDNDQIIRAGANVFGNMRDQMAKVELNRKAAVAAEEAVRPDIDKLIGL